MNPSTIFQGNMAVSKVAESIEGKDTFFIMNKTRRLLPQENTPIYSKFYFVLWANKRFTINLFSYVKNMQTILTGSCFLFGYSLISNLQYRAISEILNHC